MLIVILLLFGGVVGLGHALNIYYDIKYDRERKARAVADAKARLTKKYYL